MTAESSRRSALGTRAATALVGAILSFASFQGNLGVGAAHAMKRDSAADTQLGLASYYSRWFDGRQTAGGEIFHNDEMVAAHPTYPLGTVVRVSRLDKPASAIVRVSDRGPSIPNQKQGVIIDLSQAAASKLKMRRIGRAKVRVDVLKWGRHEKAPLIERTARSHKPVQIASK